ncbi:hypothetical protein PYW08_008426 [Mythimna loreyi]|uniref:Uncharacterized protein n=1 Tax=Mythimna loreyi TaxID=667449 RepID=A0ACC2QDC1_9NEOP|nr:hypothetical protein PYW08_008426 [Mythimna loreyi]
MPPKKVVQPNRKITEKTRSVRKEKSHINMPANFKVSIPFKSSDRAGLHIPIVKGRRPPLYTKHLDPESKVELANSVARHQLVKEEPPTFQVDNVVIIKEPKGRQTRGRKKNAAVVSDFFLNRVITETPAEVSSTEPTIPQKDTPGKKLSPNKKTPPRKILTRKRVADTKAQEDAKCAKVESENTETLSPKIKVEVNAQADESPTELEYEPFVEQPTAAPTAPVVEEPTPLVAQEEPKVVQSQPKKYKPAVKRPAKKPAPARKRGPKGKQQNAEPHVQTPSIVDLLKNQAADAEEKLKQSQQTPQELVESNSVGSNSNKSWTRDISISSNNTCVSSIGSNDFVRIDKKLPVLKLTNIDSEVKKRQNEALKAASAVADEAGEDLSDSYDSDSCGSRERKYSEQLNDDSLGVNSVHLSASSSSQCTYSRRKETSDYDKAACKLSQTMEKLDLEIIQWMGSANEDVNENLVKFRDKMFDILDREFGVITHCRHLKEIVNPQSKEDIDDACVPEHIRDCVANDNVEHDLVQNIALVKDNTPVRESPLVKKRTLVRKNTSVKDSEPVKESVRVRERTPIKDSEPVRESTRVKHRTPVKDSEPLEEKTPIEDSEPVKESARVKQSTPVKKSTPVQESPVVRESTPVKKSAPAKENTPVKDNTPVEKNTKELEKEFVIPRRPSRKLSSHSEGNVSNASTRASGDASSDDEPAAGAYDDPDYDHHDDDDTLSLFAESISGFESSRLYTPTSSAIVSRPPPVEEYIPQPVKEVDQPTEKQTYCPTKIRDDTQMLASQVTVCEKQNADSTSIFKQSNSTDDAESYQDFNEDIYLDARLDAQDMVMKPRLMDSYFEGMPKARSVVFGNLCFYNLMNCCRNYYTGACRFLHMIPTTAQIKEKLNHLDERMLIQEYLLVRRWTELRRRYGMCFVEEAAKRGLTRILVEMAYDFIVKATNESDEDTRLRVDTIEVTLLHLNSVDLSICEDLLKLPINPDQPNRTLLCDVFMATMSITQNFTRFKIVFLTLTYFMVNIDRTFNKDVVEHILERVCILPFDEPVARALIQMMRLTKADIFNNSMIGHFEKQISAEKAVLEEYTLLKNQCALSSLLASSLAPAEPQPPAASPDTTNLDNMNKATDEPSKPVITRTIGMNPPIVFSRRDTSPSDSRTHVSPGPSHPQISPSQYYVNTGPSQSQANNSTSDSSDNLPNVGMWRNRSIYPHLQPPAMPPRGGMHGPLTRGTPPRGMATRGTPTRGMMRPPMRAHMRPPQRLPFNQRLVTFKSPSNYVIRQSGPKY